MGEGFWEHPDWARQDSAEDNDDDEIIGLEYEELDAVNDWVVKLTFNRVGESKGLSGNGFFLNIPGVEDRHIILTAAHNLMKNGDHSFNLKAIYNNPYEVDPSDPSKVIFTYPTNSPFIEVSVENTSPHTYVCEGYAQGSTNPADDYGIICIPRTPGVGPKGFGFSLNLAFRKVFKGTIHVSGFRAPRGDASEPPKTIRPVTSSGSNMAYHNDHIEYWAKTEPGISGSPVWVEYNRFIAAVGIHNQGADSSNPKAGSRGALLTVGLLTQVFDWIDPGNLVRKGVQLQARPPPPPKKKRGAPATVPVASPFDRGLFLSFQNNPTGFGRVRLGSGTKFDYMPAQVDASGIVSYVFFLAAEQKWLRVDLNAKPFQNLLLSDKWDRRGCLIQHLQEPDCAWMELGLETGEMDANYSPLKKQLRMQGKQIKPYDENKETMELSFVTSPSTELFYRFILK